jgi:Holliday junction resolvase-like predicted endonuclease
MVFPQNTVRLLREFENSSNPNHLLGFHAELRVIQHYLQKGFYLKSHREKYYHTEVDIVMESSRKIVFIEVKYSSHSAYLVHRISPNQRDRLMNVYLRYMAETPKDLEFHYVVVGQSGDLEIFELLA